MENQNLNQENQNQENQTNNQDLKPKNPKNVAAGKKGAEARWKRMQAQQVPAEQKEAPVEQETVTKVTREQQETVNVYKNYIPLCAVLVVGIGIYMSYNKPVSIQAKQVTQPPPQQSTPDPFEMN